MDKAKALSELALEMANQNLPLSTNLVFGEGDPGSSVLFIGEAPGKEEDLQKRPFVGRAGQLLRKSLNEIGINPETVYITNIVKRRPPENRDPLPEEILAYEPYLKRQIEIINPKIIATLGRFAMNHFLPEAKISRDHDQVFRLKGRLIIPLFHPAAVLRGNPGLVEYAQSFRKLKQVVAKVDELLAKAPPRKESSLPPTQKNLF